MAATSAVTVTFPATPLTLLFPLFTFTHVMAIKPGSRGWERHRVIVLGFPPSRRVPAGKSVPLAVRNPKLIPPNFTPLFLMFSEIASS